MSNNIGGKVIRCSNYYYVVEQLPDIQRKSFLEYLVQTFQRTAILFRERILPSDIYLPCHIIHSNPLMQSLINHRLLTVALFPVYRLETLTV